MVRVIPFLLILAIFSGCSSSPKSSYETTTKAALERAQEQNTPASRAFEKIELNYRKKSHRNVIKRTRNFVRKYRKSEYLPLVYHFRALSLIALKRFKPAIRPLKKTLKLTESDGESLHTMATYNLAYVYFQLGKIDNSSNLLNKVNAGYLEPSNREKYYILRAKVFRLQKNYFSSAKSILNAIKYSENADNPVKLRPMVSFLDEQLEYVHEEKQLESLLREFEGSPAADRLHFQLGQHYFGVGEREKAYENMKAIVNHYPGSRHYSTAQESIRKMDFQGVVDPTRIGVVLTLSGKFEKFGYKALHGIELALGIYKKRKSKITLVVMDDRGNPDRAVLSMEELFYKHHVSAIVGPISSKLVTPMANKAQELGVPLIALTQKEAKGGDYVFNAGLTPVIQVKELIKFAKEKRGVTHFAVLAPSSKFGEAYAQAFWNELDKTDSALRGYERYQKDETDFRSYIDKMVGLSQTDARQHEVEELKLLKAAAPVKLRSKRFNRMFQLRPIVDFQAVFIPDDPKMLGQILPTFAYRDVENVIFLGTNTWNSKQLVPRAGSFANGAVFVDGFYSGSEKKSLVRFKENFEKTYGSEPGVVETLAYDAGKILRKLMYPNRIKSREELKNRLLNLTDFPGVSGKISYQDGHLAKRLHLLTVKGGKIQEIAFQ